MNNASPSFACYAPRPDADLTPLQSAVLSEIRALRVGFFRSSGILPFTLTAILRKRVSGVKLSVVESTLRELAALGRVTVDTKGYWKEARRG